MKFRKIPIQLEFKNKKGINLSFAMFYFEAEDSSLKHLNTVKL